MHLPLKLVDSRPLKHGPWATVAHLGPDKVFLRSKSKFSVINLISNKPDKNLKIVNPIRNDIVYITSCASSYEEGVLGGVLKSGDIFLSLPSKDLFLNVRGLPEFGEEFKDNGSQQNHESWCNKVQNLISTDSKLLSLDSSNISHFDSLNGNTVLLSFKAAIYIWKTAENDLDSKGSYCKGVWSSYNLSSLLKVPSWNLHSVDSRCNKSSSEVFTWTVVSLFSSEESGLCVTSQTLDISDKCSNGQIANTREVASPKYLSSVTDTILTLSKDGLYRAVAVNCSKNPSMNTLFIALGDNIFPADMIGEQDIRCLSFSASGILIICLTAAFDLAIFDRTGSRLLISIWDEQMDPNNKINLNFVFSNLISPSLLVGESKGELRISNGLICCHFQMPKEFGDCVSYARLLIMKSSIFVCSCKTHHSVWSHSDGNKTTNLNTVDRKFSKSLPKFVSKILRINKKNFVEIPEMFEVDGTNVFSPYKDMPRDLPRIFLQGLESLRSIVFFAVTSHAKVEIRSEMEAILTQSWSLLCQLITNKPDSITKEDCVLLSTNWIDGIFDLSFLDYSGAFTESFINLIKAVIPSLLEVASVEDNFHSVQHIIRLLTNSIATMLNLKGVKLVRFLPTFKTCYTQLLKLKAPDRIVEMFERIALKNGFKIEEFALQTVLSKGTLQFLHGKRHQAVQQWKLEILEQDDLMRQIKHAHSILYCLYETKDEERDSLILSFMNWSKESLQPAALDVLEISFAEIQREIIIRGICQVPSASHPIPFREVSDNLVDYHVVNRVSEISCISKIETIIELFLQLKEFEIVSIICSEAGFGEMFSLFFAYLSYIIKEKDCGKLDGSMFWDLLEQCIQTLDVDMISKLVGLVPEACQIVLDHQRTLIKSSWESLNNINLHPQTYRDVQEVEVVTSNLKRLLNLFKDSKDPERETILEAISTIDTIVDSRQRINEFYDKFNTIHFQCGTKDSALYEILESITTISRTVMNNLWNMERLELAAFALEHLPDTIRTANAVVEIFTNYGCPESTDIDKRVRAIFRRWQTVKVETDIFEKGEGTLSDYFVQVTYKFKTVSISAPKTSSFEYLIAKYNDEVFSETLKSPMRVKEKMIEQSRPMSCSPRRLLHHLQTFQDHRYENWRKTSKGIYQDSNYLNPKELPPLEDIPYWQMALRNQGARRNDAIKNSFSKEILDKLKLFHSYCKSEDESKHFMQLSFEDIMFCIVAREFAFSNCDLNGKVNSDQQESGLHKSEIHCENPALKEICERLPKPPIPRPRSVFTTKLDDRNHDPHHVSLINAEIQPTEVHSDDGVSIIDCEEMIKTEPIQYSSENPTSCTGSIKNLVESVDVDQQPDPAKEEKTPPSNVVSIIFPPSFETFLSQSLVFQIPNAEVTELGNKIELFKTEEIPERVDSPSSIPEPNEKSILAKASSLEVSHSNLSDAVDSKLNSDDDFQVEVENTLELEEKITEDEKLDLMVLNKSEPVEANDPGQSFKEIPNSDHQNKLEMLQMITIQSEKRLPDLSRSPRSSALSSGRLKKKRRPRPSLDFLNDKEKPFDHHNQTFLQRPVRKGLQKGQAEARECVKLKYVAGQFDDFLDGKKLESDQSSVIPNFSAIHFAVRQELDQMSTQPKCTSPKPQKDVGTNTEKEITSSFATSEAYLENITVRILSKLTQHQQGVLTLKNEEEMIPEILDKTTSKAFLTEAIPENESHSTEIEHSGIMNKELKEEKISYSYGILLGSETNPELVTPQENEMALTNKTDEAECLGNNLQISDTKDVDSESYINLIRLHEKITQLEDDNAKELSMSLKKNEGDPSSKSGNNLENCGFQDKPEYFETDNKPGYSHSLNESIQSVMNIVEDNYNENSGESLFPNYKSSTEKANEVKDFFPGDLERSEQDNENYESDFEEKTETSSNSKSEIPQEVKKLEDTSIDRSLAATPDENSLYKKLDSRKSNDSVKSLSEELVEHKAETESKSSSDEDHQPVVLEGRKMSKQFLKSLGVSQEFLESSFSSTFDEDETNLSETSEDFLTKGSVQFERNSTGFSENYPRNFSGMSGDFSESHSDSEIDSIRLDVQDASLRNVYLPFTEAYVVQNRTKGFNMKKKLGRPIVQSSRFIESGEFTNHGKNFHRIPQNYSYLESHLAGSLDIPNQSQSARPKSSSNRWRPKSWTGVTLLEDIQELRSQESSELR